MSLSRKSIPNVNAVIEYEFKTTTFKNRHFLKIRDEYLTRISINRVSHKELDLTAAPALHEGLSIILSEDLICCYLGFRSPNISYLLLQRGWSSRGLCFLANRNLTALSRCEAYNSSQKIAQTVLIHRLLNRDLTWGPLNRESSMRLFNVNLTIVTQKRTISNRFLLLCSRLHQLQSKSQYLCMALERYITIDTQNETFVLPVFHRLCFDRSFAMKLFHVILPRETSPCSVRVIRNRELHCALEQRYKINYFSHELHSHEPTKAFL